MKKKVILLSIALMVVATGVVSAASLWGKYMGYDIIRITVDGAPVKTDVPAFVFNNRTMVPVYLLKEAGISYSADGKNQTVDIKKPKTTVVTNGNTNKIKSLFAVADLYKSITELGEFINGTYTDLSLAQDEIISYGTRSNLDKAWERLDARIESYNNIIKRIDSVETYVKPYNIDLSPTTTIMNNYYDAIESYKSATSNFENYYASRSMSDYNVYFDHMVDATDSVFAGKIESVKRYGEFGTKIYSE